jgi:hypothetical protein
MGINMITCSTCFYAETLSDEEPCGSCGPLYGKWVAMDFLKEIPDNTPEEDEAFSALTDVVALWVAKEAPAPADPFVYPFASARIQLVEMEQHKSSALDKQVSGGHYKDLKIQPVEFIHANNIPFAEGCAIKYLCRWRDKGGIKDLEKAKHFIELLIELEGKK